MANRKEQEMKSHSTLILSIVTLVLVGSSVLSAQMSQHQHPSQPPSPPVPQSAPQQSQPTPVPPPTGPAITLTALEEMATVNNPTLKQAEAEIRAAEGRKQQAGLYPNPTAGYIGEQIRGGAFRGGEQGFFVQQEIVLGGKLGLSRNVFEQERRQALAEAEEQRLRVLNNVRVLFYQALGAQKRVELRRNLSRLADDAVETSNQLFNVGQADQPDVLETQVEAEQAKLAVTVAEQNQLRTWRSLAAVIGKPDLPLTQLEGNLEETPTVSDEWLQALLRESSAVKIAELGVTRAEASLTRARREPIPNLLLRGGLEQNRELQEPSGRPVGMQGFAELGVQIPLFNRNQGNAAAARADVERSRHEVQRIQLLLRERATPFFQSYITARATVERYREQMLPRASKAYELYLAKYKQMGAAYPQVLIAQRTLFQLQTDYIGALENLWTNALALKGFLLTDGLEAPARPGELDRPVREINLPSAAVTSTQER
jgi:cobalt-zinc-cadmium efflux system outer membrane protein